MTPSLVPLFRAPYSNFAPGTSPRCSTGVQNKLTTLDARPMIPLPPHQEMASMSCPDQSQEKRGTLDRSSLASVLNQWLTTESSPRPAQPPPASADPPPLHCPSLSSPADQPPGSVGFPAPPSALLPSSLHRSRAFWFPVILSILKR